MSNMFKEIIEILNENNIEYFIIYGTLLGKCRHDNIIPWDDDIDIAFNIKDLNKIKKIKWEKYNLDYVKFSHFYKIFYKKNKKINKRKYSWPYIDLLPYNIKGNKVHTDEYTYKLLKKSYTFDKNIIFSLRETKFLNTKTYIPNKANKLLDKLYCTDWKRACMPQYFDNTNEHVISIPRKVKCKKTSIKLSC